MNRLLPLFLGLLLLCGCAAQEPTPETTEPVPITVATETAPEVQPSLPELLADGSVVGYPMEGTVTGFLPMDDRLLVFSEKNSLTTLTLVDPKTMEALHTHEPGFLLMSRNFTVQLTDTGISYYHGAARETVVLDHSLREIHRIHAPEDMTGAPLLSSDGQILFYCTASGIRAMETDTGISRVLREVSHPVQGLSGLLVNDTVLQVTVTDESNQFRTLFLSTEAGRLLGDYEGNLTPQTAGDSFFLNSKDGAIRTILYGDVNGDTMMLQPRGADGECFFLPRINSAVTADWMESGICLDLYDLNSGTRISSLSLPLDMYPQNLIQTEDDGIWFLSAQAETGKSMLCRWDIAATAVSDPNCYAAPHFTREEPDYDGLAACALYAQEIGQKHGVEVLVYKDAVTMEPWDYHLEYEYQATVLMQELSRLDARLGNFPEGMLQTLAQRFTALKIVIVRSAVGSPESGSLEAVSGIQFFDGYDAYIVLSTDHDTEYTLYHELCHLMETVVLTESTAYDRWDNLNPANFAYDNDYNVNLSRDGSKWMQSGKEYFIDTYSMSYPKEDRARILEYAMTPGHEGLFASPNLQSKLRQLSIGIREAFDLGATNGPFLWEQYLQEPIA